MAKHLCNRKAGVCPAQTKRGVPERNGTRTNTTIRISAPQYLPLNDAQISHLQTPPLDELSSGNEEVALKPNLGKQLENPPSFSP